MQPARMRVYTIAQLTKASAVHASTNFADRDTERLFACELVVRFPTDIRRVMLRKSPRSSKRTSLSWAQLLYWVFFVDALFCVMCGGG